MDEFVEAWSGLLTGAALGEHPPGVWLALVHALVADEGFADDRPGWLPLAEVAEWMRPACGGWSVRAALVRYAQPEPSRAAAVSDLVRGVEHGMTGIRKVVGGATIVSPGAWPVDDWSTARRDVPAADLGRLARRLGPDDGRAAVAAYHGVRALTADELAAIGVYAAADALDVLGDALATWAWRLDHEPVPAPTPQVDAAVTEIEGLLAAANVTGWRWDPAEYRGQRGRGV